MTCSIPTIEGLRATKAGEYVSRIPTPQASPLVNPDYDRSYDLVTVHDANGFIHPGILLNREQLNIMRDMVWLGAQPWKRLFETMLRSPYAQLDYHMDGPDRELRDDHEYFALTRCSTAVYELTLMWYITGKRAYADKARGMIRAWADTLERDVKKDHIRTGTSSFKFAIAAEIMRYTPSSGWTGEDTEALTRYFDVLEPSMNKPYEYFNQCGYAMMGYVGRAIFTSDREAYTHAVEVETVNRDGGWRWGGSCNYSLARAVFNNGVFVEMGRDQDHAFDNMGTHGSIIQTAYIQGTHVDGNGRIVEDSGVDLYDFGNEKLLKMAATLTAYNLGVETWYPFHRNAAGEATIYDRVSQSSRGLKIWEPSIYYHYRYIKGRKPSDPRTIIDRTDGPDVTRDPYATYGDAYTYLTADKGATGAGASTVDFPNDPDLTFTPLEAIEDVPLAGAPAEPWRNNASPKRRRLDSGLFAATGNDERPTFAERKNGGLITSPYVDEDGNIRLVSSDANNGEWVAYPIDFDADFGATAERPASHFVIRYGARGLGERAGIDWYLGDYREHPTQADYEAARANRILPMLTSDTGGVMTTVTYDLADPDRDGIDPAQFTGRKTLYAYYHDSENLFKLHAGITWFKFVADPDSDPDVIAARDGSDRGVDDSIGTHPVPGDGTRRILQGTVIAAPDGSIIMDARTTPYVSYGQLILKSSPRSVVLTLKANAPLTLSIGLLSTKSVDRIDDDGPRLGRAACRSALAEVDVPDTTALSADGWVKAKVALNDATMRAAVLIGMGVLEPAVGQLMIRDWRFADFEDEAGVDAGAVDVDVIALRPHAGNKRGAGDASALLPIMLDPVKVSAGAGDPVRVSLGIPAGDTASIVDFGFRGDGDRNETGVDRILPILAPDEAADGPAPELRRSRGGDGGWQLAWRCDRPGDYRALVRGEGPTGNVVEQWVDIVLHGLYEAHGDVRFVRVRYAVATGGNLMDLEVEEPGPRELTLEFAPADPAGDEVKPISIRFADLVWTKARFHLSEWLPLPDDVRHGEAYRLTLGDNGKRIGVDFLEFATAGYAELYPSHRSDDLWQRYPLPDGLVMRLEAEQACQEAGAHPVTVDFNGRDSYMYGNPGYGCGVARMHGSALVWDRVIL